MKDIQKTEKEMSLYQMEKTLKEAGKFVRRAGHFEQQITEYGEKLTWVIDNGDWQALTAYKTKREALEAALRRLEWADFKPLSEWDGQ